MRKKNRLLRTLTRVLKALAPLLPKLTQLVLTEAATRHVLRICYIYSLEVGADSFITILPSENEGTVILFRWLLNAALYGYCADQIIQVLEDSHVPVRGGLRSLFRRIMPPRPDEGRRKQLPEENEDADSADTPPGDEAPEADGASTRKVEDDEGTAR